MTPRTAERRQALRVALIDAAERAIAAEGLVGLNARDLAGEVGCALGAIYNVFPDLDHIVYEVNSRTLAAFEAVLAARPQPSSARRGRKEAIADLVDLAEAYLDFAAANQPRWRALFEHHQSNPEADLPKWYLAQQRRMFDLVEQPLTILRPNLNDEARMLFARTMFSAVHGIVILGLDEKLMSLSARVLSGQVRTLVDTLGRGLAARSSA
ncbi:MAG: TetR/AcrR family transcriptional regulator [Bauldia sp.]